MLKPITKFTLSFCAILLLNERANASFLEGLQNVMTQLQKAQQNPNNRSSRDSSTEQAVTKESEEQVFNSLADEEAYKKHEQELKKQNDLSVEKNFTDNILPRIKKLEDFKYQIFEKYFVKFTDSKESIDSKFKNRVELFRAMKEDVKIYYNELKDLRKIFNENNENSNQTQYSYLLQVQRISFPEGPFANMPYHNNDIIEDNKGNKYLSYADAEYKFTVDSYERYLKDEYEDYGNRQKQIQQAQEEEKKKAKTAEEAKMQQAKWERESKKVRGVCDSWIASAHKKVYSLGVGDRVRCNGVNYTIQQVNANTFVGYNPIINIVIKQKYINKSECLPEVMPKAPSQYCQQP